MRRSWKIFILTTFLNTTLVCSDGRKTCNKTGTTSIDLTIDCSNLNLMTLSPGQYPLNYTTLDHIYLSGNNLTVLDPDVFRNMTTLTCIRLDDNLLEFLPSTLFRGLTKLYTLNLTKNHITQLSDRELFSSQRNLVYLYLSLNKLTFIDVSVLKPVISLKIFELSNNPFVCNCELRLTMMWCASRSLTTNATCETPSELKTLSWTKLNTTSVCSDVTADNSSSTAVLLICFFLLCATISVTVIFYYRKKNANRVSDTDEKGNVILNENSQKQCIPAAEKNRLSMIPEVTDTSSQALSCSDIGHHDEHILHAYAEIGNDLRLSISSQSNVEGIDSGTSNQEVDEKRYEEIRQCPNSHTEVTPTSNDGNLMIENALYSASQPDITVHDTKNLPADINKTEVFVENTLHSEDNIVRETLPTNKSGVTIPVENTYSEINLT